MTSRARRLLTGALVVAALVACKKKGSAFHPGDKCSPGRVECVSPTTAFFCGEGDTFVEVPCRGKAGCKSAGAVTTCDRAFAEKGDTCALAEDPKDRGFCTEDGKSVLVCRGGKLTPSLECPKADCRVDGRRADCSTFVAKRGLPCPTDSDTYCGEDEKSLLKCKSGVLESAKACHGKQGCHGGKNPACDDTLATAGDVCTLSGLVVCAEDGESELVCQNGHFALSRPCKKSGCKVTNVAEKRIECR